MKNKAKYLVPLLIVLMLVQAVCEAVLPGLMGSLVNRGVQQGGLEEGIPEAMSKRGKELISCFLSPEDRARMDGIYNVIEPESSEAQRFSKTYPAARKMTICVLREDATAQDLALARRAFDVAAHTFVLYMQQAEKSGELEEITWLFSKQEEEPDPGEFGQNLRDPNASQPSYPEGVIGKIPDGALFTMPSSEPESGVQGFHTGSLPVIALTAGGMLDFSAHTFGEERSAENMLDFEGETFGEEPEEPDSSLLVLDKEQLGSELNFSLKDGLSAGKLQQAYSLLALLNKIPAESVEAAREQAQKAGLGENRWMGSILKKRFYDELGRDTGEIEARCVGRIRGFMLLVGLLGLLASVLTLVVGRAVNITQVLWLRLLFYAPALGLGACIQAVRSSVSAKWIAAYFLGVLLLALAGALPFVTQSAGLRNVAMGLEKSLHKRRTLLPWTAALAGPVMLLILQLGCCAVLWTAREAVESALMPVGDKMAWFQCGFLYLRAFVLAACVFLLGPGRKLLAAAPNTVQKGK